MPPPPAKKFRGHAGIIQNMQLTECRREFDLPRQYPSMVKPVQTNLMWKARNANEALNTAKVLPVQKKEPQVLNKIKKLRIKLQDGRDLGELNVQVLSPGVGELNSKTITVSKLNLLNNLNKPVALSLMPMEKLGGMYKILPMDKSGYVNGDEKKLSHVPSILNKRSHTTEVQEVYRSKAVSNIALSNGCKKTISTVKERNSKELNITKQTSNNTPKHVPSVSGKRVGLNNTKKDRHPTVNTESEKLQSNNVVGDLVKKDELPDNEQPCVKSTEHLKLAKSKFPVVKCEKLKLSLGGPTKSPNLCAKETQPVSPPVSQRKERKQNFSIVNKDECVENASTPKSVSSNLAHKKNGTGKSQCYERHNKSTESHDRGDSPNEAGSTTVKRTNSIQNQPKLGRNVMVAVHNSSLVLGNNLHGEMEGDIPMSMMTEASEKECTVTPANDIEAEVTCKSNNTEQHKPIFTSDSESCFSTSLEIKDTTSQSSNDLCASSRASVIDSSEKEKLSEHWSIITKAVSSVKDDELRAKALKALADCGIGIERRVPRTPPQDLKAVHDANVQTEVFSLLDPQSFVLVREDVPKVERINETVQDLLNPVISNILPPEQTKTKHNALMTIDNSFLGPAVLPNMVDAPMDFDSFFDELCNENIGANKVKEVLSAPSPMSRKISMQLQQDFKHIKQCDEHGMLNIHRAVVNNNANTVKRLLIVLKACNESVDVLTEDGMTSLELAVQSNSSLAVVKQLLEAGAEPVQARPVHESALILASKLSSPLLSELVQYVADPSLFDQVDSEGFAPLHYCSIYGNIKGVDALVHAGAEVNLRDNRSGRTPFFHAVENNHIEVAQRLLHNGALANLPNFAGQTVLSLVDDVKTLSLRTALNKMLK